MSEIILTGKKTHIKIKKNSSKAVLMSTHNFCFFRFFLGNTKKYPSVIISCNRVVVMGYNGMIKSVMP